MQSETLAANRPKITRLPDDLINQIAAGEVVERPASVVKELVENSIDAKATRIEVRLRTGGIEEISILDNGHGMDARDLVLSVDRHTTSKITRFSDLETIRSYGFRGEALSSIASVAELTIRTRTADMEGALSLAVKYGEKDETLLPSGAPAGTLITIRHLFQRLPGRQKFLRSPGTELSHCARVLRELALGNAGISFFLFHDDRQVQSFTSQTRAGRFQECVKPPWEPLHLEEAIDDVKLEAFLSPAHVVQDRGELLVYLNGRSIRHKALSMAVRNAFLESLGPHHEPSGVLFLDIRTDWVDVNVHPQKLEVRLLRQDALYSWLLSTIRRAVKPLEGAFLSTIKEVPAGEAVLPHYTEAPSAAPAKVRYLGQTKSAFLVCEDAFGVHVVNPRTLQEKLIFERLQKVSPKPFLLEKPLVVPAKLERETELRALGFDVSVFGANEVLVKARPDILPENKVESFLRAVGPGNALEPLLASFAAVENGRALTYVEAQTLFDAMEMLDESWTCPHGKPIVITLPFTAVEKALKRC